MKKQILKKMEKQIVIIKPKSLSSKDKEKLTKAGKIVIEGDSYNIQFKENADIIKHVYCNCGQCGDRIYMPEERYKILLTGCSEFYCTRGHWNKYQKK